LGVVGVVVERGDKTASLGALVDHRAAGVAMQVDARVTTHRRRDVQVDGVRCTHVGQVVVLVLVETLLFTADKRVKTHLSPARVRDQSVDRSSFMAGCRK